MCVSLLILWGCQVKSMGKWLHLSTKNGGVFWNSGNVRRGQINCMRGRVRHKMRDKITKDGVALVNLNTCITLFKNKKSPSCQQNKHNHAHSSSKTFNEKIRNDSM